MKKIKKIVLSILAVLVALIIGYGVWYVVHYKFYDKYKESLVTYTYEDGSEFSAVSETVSDVEGMVLVSENENLKLYADLTTTDVAVYDKRNGTITYSNPVDAQEDPIANETNKNVMQSQLFLTYYNASRSECTMDNYSSCVELGQFETEGIEDGIRFVYTIGDMSSKTGIVPTYITEERLNEVTAKMSEEGSKFILSRYKEEEDGIYTCGNLASKASSLRKATAYFEEAGWTEEDYETAMEEAGAEDDLPITFVVPLEYRLGEDYVEVNIPAGQIVESGGGYINKIDVLSYFGAAGTDEDGYILVPNGSGSIINFNNGKTTAADYSQFVYGIDPLASNDFYQVQNTEDARMPLWGLQRSDSGILATIESGDTLAQITAGVSGSLTSYNHAYATFTIRNWGKMSMFGDTGNEAEIPILEKNLYAVDLTTRYTFLTDEYEGYSGMANYYRERLLEEEALQTAESTEELPLYLDIVGSVKRTSHILGIQYDQVYAMTTFDQAKEIAEYYVDQGITPVVNYQGWCNGGYYMDVPDKITGINKLGGKSDFESLSDYLESNGGKLYADVVFEKVTFASKRYKYEAETSKYYCGYVAAFGAVSPTDLMNCHGLGYSEVLYDLLSPKFLPRYVEKFISAFDGYDVTGISLRDLGSTVYSDKKRSEVINREQAKYIVLDQLTALEDTGNNLMLSSANSYAWQYADDLINVPTSDNDYFIVDEQIPFYEMILHGTVNYTGSSINLAEDYDEDEVVLNLIEYGAAPHFTFTWESATELKNTGVRELYSVSFNENEDRAATGISAFRDDAVNIYNRVNEVLAKVNGSKMVEHEVLQTGVKKITYDNGAIIYINTTDNDVTADGVTISAKNYLMKEAQ